MISVSEKITNMLGMPARRIDARVELYQCSTLQNDDYNRVLLNTFLNSDALKELKVERTTEDGKFFGFGISQKLIVKLRDKDRLINITRGQVLEISFGVEDDYTYPCPLFRVEEVSRDENTNDLTITAYDFLYKAGEHRVSELGITDYTIRSFIYACAALLNLPVKFDIDDSVFDQAYPEGANFDGSETLRGALNAVAEATQTIFFVDWDWRLTFKRLDQNADPVLHIDKSKYFELKNKSDRTLTSICHATELGDNVEISTGEPGVVQYVRNNPFWDLRDDIDTILENALAAIAGITISQFDCSWRGNFALELGDKITMTTKDNNILVGYVLNDTITYNGGLKEQTSWQFTEHSAETASNPITIGETLRQTYAKVDKVNKEITLVASEAQSYTDGRIEAQKAEMKMTTDAITQRVINTENSLNETNQQISELEIRADGIDASVASVQETLGSELDDTNSTIEELKKSLNENVDSINNSIVELSTQVSASMTDEEIRFQVQTALSNGVDTVSTTTGYTFDNEGLTIAKSGSEMTTQITEDGMTVYRGSEGVLIANNEGVHAEDLTATTYLIIGDRSRFENFERDGSTRTGCFWIG